MKKRPGAKRSEKYARLFLWEMQTPAYRSLSGNARALLLEFRIRYNGRENRLFFSARDMADCLNVARNTAYAARDELLTRGWVRIVERSGLNRKDRTAAVYALTSEPLSDALGAVAPKDYMRWQPAKPVAEKDRSRRKVADAERVQSAARDDQRFSTGSKIEPHRLKNCACESSTGSKIEPHRLKNCACEGENPGFTGSKIEPHLYIPSGGVAAADSAAVRDGVRGMRSLREVREDLMREIQDAQTAAKAQPEAP